MRELWFSAMAKRSIPMVLQNDQVGGLNTEGFKNMQSVGASTESFLTITQEACLCRRVLYKYKLGRKLYIEKKQTKKSASCRRNYNRGYEDMMNKNLNGLLEEYKSLRQEILQSLRLRIQIYFTTLTAFSGFCFWASNNSNRLFTELSVLFLLLLIYFSYCLILALNTKINIKSSYIAARIEPALEDMHWESNISKFYTDFKPKGFASEVALYRISYCILSLITFVLGYSKLIGSMQLFKSQHIVILLMALAYFALILLTWREKETRDSLFTKWQRLLRGTKGE